MISWGKNEEATDIGAAQYNGYLQSLCGNFILES